MWDSNTLQEITKLKEHKGCIVKLLSIGNNEIASCSDDGTVRIWDLISKCLLQKLKVPSADFITDVMLVSSRYLLCCWKSHLTFWKRNNSDIFEDQHDVLSSKVGGSSWSMISISAKLIAVSVDNVIKFYYVSETTTNDSLKIQFEFKLTGHPYRARDLKLIGLENHFLLSSSDDGNCKLWNPHQRRSIKRYSSQIGNVLRMMVLSPSIFMSVSQQIKTWKIYSGECHTIEYEDGHKYLWDMTLFTNNQILLVGSTCRLEIWEY
jgi:WD40 repeat protein